MKVNWKQPSSDLTPGIYAFTVRNASEKTSKNGNPMIEVVLDASDFNKKLCYDTIMVSGDGWDIGRKKLNALGIADGVDEFDMNDLIGKQGWVAVKSSEYQGRVSLKVDINIGASGYFTKAPLGVIAPPEPVSDPDPFGA